MLDGDGKNSVNLLMVIVITNFFLIAIEGKLVASFENLHKGLF